ncbi:ATP-dependent RNA helicase dhx29 [Geranomyces michiganensis]|nr:ATP-dependent RNA helicase dhx29 [Geranomyces michiganensis]
MAKKKRAAPLPSGFVRSFATTSSQSKKHDNFNDEEGKPADPGPPSVSEPVVADTLLLKEQDTATGGENYDTRVAGLKVDADEQRYGKRKKAVLDNPAVPALVLSPEAERALTDFIAERSIVKSRDWFAAESAEPSSHIRLHTAYLTLEKQGFSPDAIENAMTAVGGQNIAGMLDWLCLSLPLAQLPPGFTDKMEPAQPIGIISGVSVIRKVVEDKRTAGARSHEQKAEPDLDMKSWILNNMSNESSDSESETTDKRSGSETPTQRYARLYLTLDELKHQSALAKAAGDTSRKKELQVNIRTVREEMLSAESDPQYKEHEAADLITVGRLDRSSAPKAEKPPAAPVVKDEDAPFLNMIFDETSPSEPSARPVQSTRLVSLPITNWTGKTPKQLLQEWVTRKARGTKIIYFRIQHGSAGIRAGVRFSGGNGKVIEEGTSVDSDPAYCAEKPVEAENLAAATALYRFCKNLPLHRSLPPAYKDIWLEWVSSDEQQSFKAQVEEGSRRVAFVDRFYVRRELRLREYQLGRNVSPPSSAAKVVTANRKSQGGMDAKARIAAMQRRTQTQPYKKLLKQRATLPVSAMRASILDVIREHRVVVVSGETGSGKSTQIPQFVVEDGISRGETACRVVCTQPRRISATSIASRVSEELGDPGQVGRDGTWVGYQVRLDNRVNPDTLLTFCTVGILLKRLESDPDLQDVTHIFVDEVHERSLDSDFLILCLRGVLERRPNLKIILMSATADADRFASYFERTRGVGKVPTIHVPGRTFPVTTYHLEDAIEATNFVLEERRVNMRDAGTVNISTGGGKTARVTEHEDDDDSHDDELLEGSDSTTNTLFPPELAKRNYSASTLSTLEEMDPRRINFELLESLIRFVVANAAKAEDQDVGSLLVFLPGVGEIKKVRERLNGVRGMWLLDLHSTLSNVEQAKVFQNPPKGQIKVVLSTNIAETGITIPDVTVVIDAMRAREVQYDRKRNVTRLTEILISKANAMQRRGRAGRVREGVCWHLCSRKQWERLPSHRPPEMVRTPLEEVCLRVRACGFEGSVSGILNACLDPPPERNVERAIDALKTLHAFTSDERLTQLGQKLCHLPLDARLGKMLLTACALRCVDPILTLCAVLSGGKSVFLDTPGERWKEFVWGVSDLMMAVQAYNAYCQVQGSYRTRKKWCESKDLAFEALSMVGETRSQITRALLDCGVVATVEGAIDPAFDKYGERQSVVSTAIAAGSYPNVFLMDPSPPVMGGGDLSPDVTPVTLHAPGHALPSFRLHRTSPLIKALGTARVKELQRKGWGVTYNVRAGDGVKTLTCGDFTNANPVGIFCLAASYIEAQISANR